MTEGKGKKSVKEIAVFTSDIKLKRLWNNLANTYNVYMYWWGRCDEYDCNEALLAKKGVVTLNENGTLEIWRGKNKRKKKYWRFSQIWNLSSYEQTYCSVHKAIVLLSWLSNGVIDFLPLLCFICEELWQLSFQNYFFFQNPVSRRRIWHFEHFYSQSIQWFFFEIEWMKTRNKMKWSKKSNKTHLIMIDWPPN